MIGQLLYIYCFQSLQEYPKPCKLTPGRRTWPGFQSLQEYPKRWTGGDEISKFKSFQSLQEYPKQLWTAKSKRHIQVSNPYRNILSGFISGIYATSFLVSNPYRNILSDCVNIVWIPLDGVSNPYRNILSGADHVGSNFGVSCFQSLQEYPKPRLRPHRRLQSHRFPILTGIS